MVFARHVKTRSAARRLIEAGHVRLNGQRVEDVSKAVRPGDILTLALPHGTLALAILAPASRRGPPGEAQTLYRLLRDE